MQTEYSKFLILESIADNLNKDFDNMKAYVAKEPTLVIKSNELNMEFTLRFSGYKTLLEESNGFVLFVSDMEYTKQISKDLYDKLHDFITHSDVYWSAESVIIKALDIVRSDFITIKENSVDELFFKPETFTISNRGCGDKELIIGVNTERDNVILMSVSWYKTSSLYVDLKLLSSDFDINPLKVTCSLGQSESEMSVQIAHEVFKLLDRECYCIGRRVITYGVV